MTGRGIVAVLAVLLALGTACGGPDVATPAPSPRGFDTDALLGRWELVEAAEEPGTVLGPDRFGPAIERRRGEQPGAGVPSRRGCSWPLCSRRGGAGALRWTPVSS
ncbi:MAG: hypothetical protein JWM15_4132 [Cryptosporangiaceae bacterium]|jgi:hypothetical protein|nr:hypothetical protein [Cryptosporangiaceae bacterium]